MRANNWLYHYYMVQSKLQYGMQFEAQTSPRVPSAGPTGVPPPAPAVPMYAYHHQQSPHGAGGGSGGAGDHRQDAYPPVDNHHQQQHHHQQQEPVHNYHQQLPPPDGYFRYAATAAPATAVATATSTVPTVGTAKRRRRLEPEPVDYSVHSPEQTPPLKTEDGGHSMTSDSPPSPAMGGDSGGTRGGCAAAVATALSSSLPSATSLGRSRALVKAAMDPGDLMMETWNPSPPWSDCCSGNGALQKVPDVDMLSGSGVGGGGGGYCGQPTPPTPGSGGSYHPTSGGALTAPHHHPDEVPTADLLHQQHSHPQNHHHHQQQHHHHHQPSTFTFDWPGEQYVPNMHHEALVEPTPHYLVPFPPWPHATTDHHRLFPLQPPPPGSLNRPSLIVRVDQDTVADTSVQGKRA